MRNVFVCLRGGNVHVNSGNLLDTLPSIAVVIDAFRSADLFQHTVTGIGPCCPPHLEFGIKLYSKISPPPIRIYNWFSVIIPV